MADSFEQSGHRQLEDIISDMRIAWARWQARHLRIELADQLADAVLKGSDPAQARMLAQLIVRHRGDEQRGLGGVS